MNAHTERHFNFLPAGWLRLLTVVTLVISGCGESTDPAAEQSSELAEKTTQAPQSDTSAANEQKSAAKKASKTDLATEPSAGAELQLPGLPQILAAAPHRSDSDKAASQLSAPKLTKPSFGPIAANHSPLQPKHSEREQPTDSDSPPAESSSQQSNAAATVQAASQVIDLRKLQKPAGANALQTTPTQLSLTTTASLPELKSFYENELTAAGWQSVKSDTAAPLTLEYGQLEFTKDGFQLGVTLSRPTGSDQTSISISNYGNLDAQQLPSPAECQRLFSNSMSVLYVTAEDVSTTATSCLEKLAADGWQAYTRPYSMTTENKSQRSLSLKQNGVGLSVVISVAPTRQNQTTVQYALQMLGDELPAPMDAQAIEFLESPLQLSCDTQEDIAKTLTFYRQQLAEQGWKESGAANEQPTEAVAVFQRNAGLPIVLRLNRSNDGQRTHVAIAEFEMPQDAPAAVTYQAPAASPVAEAPAMESHLADAPLSNPVASHNPLAETRLSETTETDKALVKVPAGQEPVLPGVLPGLMTFEDWLQKHHYKASPERLNQFAKEMEAIANRSAELLADEKPSAKAVSADPATALLQTLGARSETNAGGQITTLDLHGTKFGDSQLGLLSHQRELAALDLSETPVTDQGLKALLQLSKLRSLNLAETALTDAAIPQLIQLRSLQELDLRGTKISPAGVKTLGAALPECNIEQ